MTLKNLTIGYQPPHGSCRVVARGLQADLPAGQLTCLLGRNGTGKSTLLRTLAGLQKPLAGSLEGIDGPPQRLVSVVLTERPDLRNLTVAEVVGLGRTPYTDFWGRLTQADRDIVDEAIGQVGLPPEMKGADVGRLSDGEYQKVMIAKALAQQTPVILLDEPTAFLDYPSRREIMQMLADMAHRLNKTILLSTHDVELAARHADAIWFLDGSGLRCLKKGEADPASLFDTPAAPRPQP